MASPSNRIQITFPKSGLYQIKVKDAAGNESKMKEITYSRSRNRWQWREWK